MLKISTIIFCFCCLMTAVTPASAQLKIGGRNIDTKKALQAGKDMAAAITLSDEDIATLCREAVTEMDRQNPVAGADSPYAQRLEKLTANIKEVNGLPLNFKVYLVTDVNAFACGDGSIRVFAGLMDLMNDGELIAVIGHEIGHVLHTDSKDAMKNAYMASAARNAAGAVGGTVGKLSQSQLGELVTAFTGAQFSQKQEFEADDYGFEFSIRQGYPALSMASSLEKLVELSKGSKSSLVQRMFSSHPDSEKRATRLREKASRIK